MRIGDYELIAPLGRGGMGDVFLAMKHGPDGLNTAKLSVVKQLSARHADDPDYVTMLLDEARITSQLRHPNVAQTFEVGVHDDRPFLVMEYLDGQTLRSLRHGATAAGKRLPATIEYAILIDALAGLHHAHELTSIDGKPLSLVHRDVSPHNVFITIDGAVKLLDFGIAKSTASEAETRQGMIKGKLRYMSPEQIACKPLDRRADVFAVGIILWEAATRRPFWAGLEQTEIIAQLLSGSYAASPRSIDGQIPEEIDVICRRALAHDPKDRYATAAEFAAALEAFVAADMFGAHRELARLVDELSRGERAKLQDVIQRAVQRRRQSASFAHVITSPREREIQEHTVVMAKAPLPPPPPAVRSPMSPASPASPRPPTSATATRVVLTTLAAAAVLGALALFGFVSRKSLLHGRTQPAAARAPADAVTPHEPLAVEPLVRAPAPARRSPPER